MKYGIVRTTAKALKPEEFVDKTTTCVECGVLISGRLELSKGLCIVCIARRKNPDPLSLLYPRLIQRVHNATLGFDSLSESEKMYYALSLFRNEINNGGFHQFFFNSSGSYYELIESGLISFDEPGLLELLHQAKKMIFRQIKVPIEMEPRREQMVAADPYGDLLDKLNAVDQQFYRTADTLSPKLEGFAREKGLVAAAEG